MSESRDWLDLLDWRRRVAELYRRVRALRGPNMVPAHSAWLEGRTSLVRDHPASPLPADRRGRFHRLSTWPYDPAFAFTAPVEPVAEERVGDDAFPLVRFGRVTLPVGALDVYWIDVYGGGLFLPFRDGTSGHDTYGGGRYLLDTAKGADLGATADGELVVDFNFAFQPSCAWDARWSCPLAPAANTLEEPVAAGERLR